MALPQNIRNLVERWRQASDEEKTEVWRRIQEEVASSNDVILTDLPEDIAEWSRGGVKLAKFAKREQDGLEFFDSPTDIWAGDKSVFQQEPQLEVGMEDAVPQLKIKTKYTEEAEEGPDVLAFTEIDWSRRDQKHYQHMYSPQTLYYSGLASDTLGGEDQLDKWAREASREFGLENQGYNLEEITENLRFYSYNLALPMTSAWFETEPLKGTEKFKNSPKLIEAGRRVVKRAANNIWKALKNNRDNPEKVLIGKGSKNWEDQIEKIRRGMGYLTKKRQAKLPEDRRAMRVGSVYSPNIEEISNAKKSLDTIEGGLPAWAGANWNIMNRLVEPKEGEKSTIEEKSGYGDMEQQWDDPEDLTSVPPQKSWARVQTP